jgi:hypothetical protein
MEGEGPATAAEERVRGVWGRSAGSQAAALLQVQGSKYCSVACQQRAWPSHRRSCVARGQGSK